HQLLDQLRIKVQPSTGLNRRFFFSFARHIGSFAESLCLTHKKPDRLYGVDCDPKKDTSIGLTNVNILNRFGTPMLIELQVQRSPEAARAASYARPPEHASTTPAAPYSLHTENITLSLPSLPKSAAAEPFTAKQYPCNGLLLDKLRATDPGKADALACVKLSIPKEYVLGNTTNGAATYSGDFSQYVRVRANAPSEPHQAKHGE
ncbi:hypothetical protein, partial [Trinickia sp.]|uniref:hypothetical protein n=1 Tax=Trinickia sp. TaxID=2571163 RepID=UPI003F7D77C7